MTCFISIGCTLLVSHGLTAAKRRITEFNCSALTLADCRSADSLNCCHYQFFEGLIDIVRGRLGQDLGVKLPAADEANDMIGFC